MSSFLDLVDAVGAYYGTGSDQWNIIAQNGINSPESLEIIRQVPGVNVTVSNSGQILGYDFNNAFPNNAPASSVINSNAQGGLYGGDSFSSNIPASATPPDTAHPNGSMSSGAKLTGVGSTVATVADRLSLAVVGVSLGTKLGKLIDTGLYNFNPNWFDENFPTMNPETWDTLASTEGGKNFIRGLFGLENDSATMYLDERMLAYTYMTLLANNGWGGAESVDYDISDLPSRQQPSLTPPIAIGTPESYILSRVSGGQVTREFTFTTLTGAIRCASYTNGTKKGVIFASDTQATFKRFSNGAESGTYTCSTVYTFNNQQVYYTKLEEDIVAPDNNTQNPNGSIDGMTAWIMIYGTVQGGGDLPGVSTNPEATTQINPQTLINPTTQQAVTPNDNIDDVLQALKTQYPDLFNNSIYTDVPQPDGTTNTITYIPVPYPNNANTAQPTTDTTPDINPQIDPQITPENRPDAAENVSTEVTTPVNNAPDTGTGTSPTTPAPTGGASSLWAVYNPTQTQVDDFGAWLWSSNFVEQIKKMFSDPMQGIIGLHKIFATPSTGGAQNIKVGYLDSGVPSAIVTSQYTDIDCGAVNVAEYFGNVFDYEDTNIRLYLPFIGIVDLSTSDVMRGNVRVVYHVDVITGACLADVIVTRDSAGGVLYQYSGDAAVRYPVSSGSYMGMVNGVLAIAGAVIGVASGGAALPAVMGAVGGIMNSHTDVKHSGSFSGAAGAMGAKIPYLIIERPQTAIANDFISYQGIGDNRVVNVGSLAGYFKMADVHTEGVINASEQEIEQVKALLEGGVIQ